MQVKETDITLSAGESVTLTATTSAGTIAWFNELGDQVGTGSPVTLYGLQPGTHQFSAVATKLVTLGDETFERVGMAVVLRST